MADKLRFFTVEERLGQNRKSEYLGAEDIDDGTEPILTIKTAWDGVVTTQKGKEFAEGILFEEKSVPGIHNVRPFIINATNRKALRKLFGSAKQKDIEGKRIQLYIDHGVRDPQTGGKCDGIRIRPFAPEVVSAVKCEKCGKSIDSASGMTAAQVAAYTKKKYGKSMCAECAKKAADAVKSTTEVTDEANG